jgi:hypothetical protein
VIKTGGASDSLFLIAGSYNPVSRLSAGLRVTLCHRRIMEYRDTGAGVDLSLLWSPGLNMGPKGSGAIAGFFRPFSFGLAVNNCLSPEFRMKQRTETWPVHIKSSASWSFRLFEEKLIITPAGGLEIIPSCRVTEYSTGTELTLWQVISFRGGYRISRNVFTLGGGIRIRNISLNMGSTLLSMGRGLYTFDMKTEF